MQAISVNEEVTVQQDGTFLASSDAVLQAMDPDFFAGDSVVYVNGEAANPTSGDTAVNSTASSNFGYLRNYVSDVTSSLMTFASSAATAAYGGESGMQRLPIRETHPRMPWHDLHAAVSGVAARDVASHFIQVCKTLLCYACPMFHKF